MAEVSAATVAALRKQTGAGMMDCKRALTETGGDLEAAKDWLRTKGLAGAAKRAGRVAQQGAVEVRVEPRVGVIVEVACETDFVAKGDDMARLLDALVEVVLAHGTDDLASRPLGASTVAEELSALAAKLGEKLELGRCHRFATDDGLIDGYKHIQNERGTIGVLVELGGVDAGDEAARTVAHDLALHIASAAPRYVSRDDVPPDAVERERELLTELTRNEGKPEQAIPKIVEGRLAGFYKDQVLLEQPFVRDPKTTVADLLASLGPGAVVRRFARVKVGEE